MKHKKLIVCSLLLASGAHMAADVQTDFAMIDIELNDLFKTATPFAQIFLKEKFDQFGQDAMRYFTDSLGVGSPIKGKFERAYEAKDQDDFDNQKQALNNMLGEFDGYISLFKTWFNEPQIKDELSGINNVKAAIQDLITTMTIAVVEREAAAIDSEISSELAGENRKEKLEALIAECKALKKTKCTEAKVQEAQSMVDIL